MTDLPFLAAQASDEVGDRFIDFVGHIFLHVETGVDRHLGLVFERAGKVGGGTRKAVASGDVDEQLCGTGFLQLVRIDLHQGCVLRRLTIERDIVGHDNAGRAGVTGPGERLGIDGFLDLAEVAENATFEQHHSGEEIVLGGGLGAFACAEMFEVLDPVGRDVCPVLRPHHGFHIADALDLFRESCGPEKPDGRPPSHE